MHETLLIVRRMEFHWDEIRVISHVEIRKLKGEPTNRAQRQRTETMATGIKHSSHNSDLISKA